MNKVKLNIVQCSGYWINSDHKLYNVYSLKTPFGLLISFITIFTFVTTITYSTITRLHNLQTLHSNLYCTIAHKVS
jgi:hypothetical protein